MTTSAKLINSLDWTIHTIRFIKQHFFIIIGLGLVAAFGRAIQLKAFGPIGSSLDLLLELVVESARLLIFFYTLGLTNIKTGVGQLIKFSKNKQERKQSWHLAAKKMHNRWPSLLANLLAFLAIAFLINALIDHIAYETCLYITLKTRQLISDQSSEWAIILFFKNISVIPFTLVFNALFCLWLVNRIPKRIAYR